MRTNADNHASTPEEARWRASVYAPEKMRKKVKGLYALLGVWILITLTWIIAVCLNTEAFGWWTVLVLSGGYLNSVIGILNTKRVIAGKKPL